jgi:hypothetical protein
MKISENSGLLAARMVAARKCQSMYIDDEFFTAYSLNRSRFQDKIIQHIKVLQRCASERRTAL